MDESTELHRLTRFAPYPLVEATSALLSVLQQTNRPLHSGSRREPETRANANNNQKRRNRSDNTSLCRAATGRHNHSHDTTRTSPQQQTPGPPRTPNPFRADRRCVCRHHRPARSRRRRGNHGQNPRRPAAPNTRLHQRLVRTLIRPRTTQTQQTNRPTTTTSRPRRNTTARTVRRAHSRQTADAQTHNRTLDRRQQNQAAYGSTKPANASANTLPDDEPEPRPDTADTDVSSPKTAADKPALRSNKRNTPDSNVPANVKFKTK